MKFEVIGPDKIPRMETSSVSCIDFEKIDVMAAAGFKFKLDGKLVSRKEVHALNDSKPVETLIRCLETGETFHKQSEAAKAMNIDPAQVSDSIKTGKKRSGYTFEKVMI